MKNTVQDNLRMWNEEHPWTKDGDEWDGQARFHGRSYEEWKRSLIDEFLRPHLSPDATVVEIAPGHGRWTETIVENCRRLYLVDLSPNCIEFCRERFAGHDHVVYAVNDGTTLPGVPDGEVDFLWSFDAFVHMDASVIGGYLAQAQRVLRPGGTVVLHHAGRAHAFLGLGFLKSWGRIGRDLYKVLSLGIWNDDDGWRSDVSGRLVRELAVRNGLVVESQTQTWGPQGEYGVLRYKDWMTTIRKPV